MNEPVQITDGDVTKKITNQIFRVRDRFFSDWPIKHQPGLSVWLINIHRYVLLERTERLAVAVICSAILVFNPAFAAEVARLPPFDTGSTPTPNEQELADELGRPPKGSTRTITPIITDAPPAIDGRLDDEVWLAESASGDFWVTTEQRWPDEPTEVMVLSDRDTIYVAFRAYDSQPDEVRSIESVRDRRLGFDDQLVVEIDSFGDHEGVSRFYVNARGTQNDSIAGGRASRISWKGDWDVAVARTGDGWTAEFAIPYQILNYRPGAEEFSINFARYHSRTKQWSRWADITPQNKPEEMGRLIGLSAPAGKRIDTWTFMPFVLAGSNVVDREGDLQDEMITGGMDILFAPTSNMTGVVSLNPDFTQVETQITDVNFSYNEKAVADPRVFFREGSAYYGSDNRIFYSPKVPDFNTGGKMFGQEGALRYGGFVTFAPDSRVDGVARLAYALDQTHEGNLIFVQTDRADLDGTTVAFAADGREQIGTFWEVDLASTRNKVRNENSESGSMYEVRGGWQGDHWGAGIDLDDYDKDFVPANALIRNDRLGTNGRNSFVNYYQNFGGQTISESTLNIVHSDRETDDGRTQFKGWYLGAAAEWNSYARTGVEYYEGEYRPLSGSGRGDFSNRINHDRYWTLSLDLNTHGSRMGYGGSYSSGVLGGGDYEYAYGYVWSRPTNNTSLSVALERLESFGTTRQYVIDGGWDITPTNSIVFRHINTFGDDYWRLGYLRVVRKGLDIFVLFDKEPTGDEALSLKFLWTIS
jgi:hypothetical protein